MSGPRSTRLTHSPFGLAGGSSLAFWAMQIPVGSMPTCCGRIGTKGCSICSRCSATFAMDAMRDRLPSWVLPVALLAVSLAVRPLHPQGMLLYLPLLASACWRTSRSIARPYVASLAHHGFRSCRFVPRCRIGARASANWMPEILLLGLFFAAVACSNTFGGFLRNSGAQALGECSFGIYLMHGIALSLPFFRRHCIDEPLYHRPNFAADAFRRCRGGCVHGIHVSQHRTSLHLPGPSCTGTNQAADAVHRTAGSDAALTALSPALDARFPHPYGPPSRLGDA